MATHTLGTNSTSSLIAVQFTPNISDADLATIVAGIMNPDFLNSVGVKTTLAMNATATATVGSATGIAAGMQVYGVGVVPGTTVLAISGTTVTLSIAATVSATNNVIFSPVNRDWTVHFSRQGLLKFPGRSLADVQVKPNDYIAIDPLSGAVVILPPAAVSLTGSIWTFT
jgi:hypothetical protein